MPRTIPAMSRAELLALPSVLDLATAGRVLRLGKSKSYSLVQRGEWPTTVLRIGVAYRIPTAELLALLGVEREDEQTKPSGAA